MRFTPGGADTDAGGGLGLRPRATVKIGFYTVEGDQLLIKTEPSFVSCRDRTNPVPHF